MENDPEFEKIIRAATRMKEIYRGKTGKNLLNSDYLVMADAALNMDASISPFNDGRCFKCSRVLTEEEKKPGGVHYCAA